MSCDENRRGITATKVWNFITAPWFWCRDAGYLLWCHSVFCHGDETRDTGLRDSRIWLLEIRKKRKPEIPAWEQRLMAGMRDSQRERWSDWEMARETWPEWMMAWIRGGQKGLGFQKTSSDTMKNFWTPLLIFSVHTIHIYIHKWLNKKISI